MSIEWILWICRYEGLGCLQMSYSLLPQGHVRTVVCAVLLIQNDRDDRPGDTGDHKNNGKKQHTSRYSLSALHHRPIFYFHDYSPLRRLDTNPHYGPYLKYHCIAGAPVFFVLRSLLSSAFVR